MSHDPRHWLPDALWDIRQDTLSLAARAVYGAIARCVTKGVARPSTARLARMVDSSARTVIRAVAELEDGHLIVVVRRYGALSVYRLTRVSEWTVAMTSAPQSPVGAETGDRAEPNRYYGEPEPVPDSHPLGSTAGNTEGRKTLAADAAGCVLPSWFMQFWNEYPIKEGKQKALAAWIKLNPPEGLVKHIMAGLTLWKMSERWAAGYVPHPAKWLAQRSWEDEPAPVQPYRRGNRVAGESGRAQDDTPYVSDSQSPAYISPDAIEARAQELLELNPQLSSDRASRQAEQELARQLVRRDPP